MEIVETELGSAGTNVVDSASKAFGLALKLGARGNLAFGSVLLNVSGDRLGDMELVGVGVRVLGFLEVLNLPGTEFVVLLRRS